MRIRPGSFTSMAHATGAPQARQPRSWLRQAAGCVPLPEREARRERGKARSDSGGVSCQAVVFWAAWVNSSKAALVRAAYISDGPPPMYTAMASVSASSARVQPSLTSAWVW